MNTNSINFKFQFLSSGNNDLIDSVTIDQIYLAKNNPRYTLIKISQNFEDFIIKDIDYDYDEKAVFSILTNQEGDYSDLLKLLNSIYENGFTNKYDPIYLVKVNQKFVVAEGNRRIMCLKLINGDLELEEKYNFLNGYVKDVVDEINEPLSSRNNYKNCIDLIKKIKKKFISAQQPVTIYCKIPEDEAELWSAIYNDKHLTGERRGLRRWSRGKYFADLLNIFPIGINEKGKIFNKFKQNFQKDLSKVKDDYKNALFVYSIIDVAEFNSEFVDGNSKTNVFNNEHILEEMISLERISALELTHSFYKVRKIICDEILNIDLEEFKNEYFAIDFPESENLIINFSEKKIKTESFLNFIYKNWKDKIITTRPIKKEKYENFINDLLILLDGENFTNSLTEEELSKINFFNLSDVALNNVIKANAFRNPKLVKIFQSYKNIRDNNKKFVEWVKQNFLKKNINTLKIEPKYVFYNLIEQAVSIDVKFLNARGATFRTIIEQIYIWNGFNKISNNERKKYLQDIIENKFKVSLYRIGNDVDFNDFINEFTDFNINDPFLEDGWKKFFDEKIWQFMNNCLHSLHYIYFSLSGQKINAIEIIEKFEAYQSDILNLLRHLKIEKLHKMNELMIQILRENDDDYKQVKN